VNDSPDSTLAVDANRLGSAAPSLARTSLLCLGVLVAFLTLVVALRFIAGVQLPQWLSLVALLVAVHVCARYSISRVGRPLRIGELVHLGLGCAIAFCLIDEGLILAFQFAGSVESPHQYEVAKAIVAILIDAAIVFVMVFVTVPIATRIFGRRNVA
jgi:hypothetical protein